MARWPCQVEDLDGLVGRARKQGGIRGMEGQAGHAEEMVLTLLGPSPAQLNLPHRATGIARLARVHARSVNVLNRCLPTHVRAAMWERVIARHSLKKRGTGPLSLSLTTDSGHRNLRRHTSGAPVPYRGSKSLANHVGSTTDCHESRCAILVWATRAGMTREGEREGTSRGDLDEMQARSNGGQCHSPRSNHE